MLLYIVHQHDKSAMLKPSVK